MPYPKPFRAEVRETFHEMREDSPDDACDTRRSMRRSRCPSSHADPVKSRFPSPPEHGIQTRDQARAQVTCIAGVYVCIGPCVPAERCGLARVRKRERVREARVSWLTTSTCGHGNVADELRDDQVLCPLAPLSHVDARHLRCV